MKVLLSSVIVLGFLLLMLGCSGFVKGDGELIKNKVIVKDFNHLNIAAVSAEIEYVQSESIPGLSVTTDRNVQEMIEIKQEGQILSIKLKKEYEDKLIWPTRFTIAASSKTLNELNLAGKGVFNLNSPLRTEQLKISVAGSGTINLEDSLHTDMLRTSIAGKSTINADKLDVTDLKAQLAGSGLYNLAGTAEKVSFQVAGKGKVKALKLKADEVSCQIAGYSNMEVYATEKLRLQLAGIGIIRYKGTPSISQQGFGFVRQVD